MKPIKNTIEIPKYLVAKRRLGEYRCKFCHAIDCGTVRWVENSYGSASLISLDGDYDNYDTEGSDTFNITEYICRECGESACNLDDIFEEDVEDGEEEE